MLAAGTSSAPVAAASTVAAASARAAPPKAVKLKKRPRAGSDDDEWAPPAGAAGGLKRATEAYIARAVAAAAGVNDGVDRGRPKRQAAIEAVAKADLCQWQESLSADAFVREACVRAPWTPSSAPQRAAGFDATIRVGEAYQAVVPAFEEGRPRPVEVRADELLVIEFEPLRAPPRPACKPVAATVVSVGKPPRGRAISASSSSAGRVCSLIPTIVGTVPSASTDPPLVTLDAVPVAATDPPLVTLDAVPVAATDPPLVTLDAVPVAATDPPLVTLDAVPVAATDPPLVALDAFPVTGGSGATGAKLGGSAGPGRVPVLAAACPPSQAAALATSSVRTAVEAPKSGPRLTSAMTAPPLPLPRTAPLPLPRTAPPLKLPKSAPLPLPRGPPAASHAAPSSAMGSQCVAAVAASASQVAGLGTSRPAGETSQVAARGSRHAAGGSQLAALPARDPRNAVMLQNIAANMAANMNMNGF
ncbi:hypothetical protein EMIHUDRAFT_203748 [Emiliania huxleyi CCMP1516]|uniref:Uncharacterized protein n=2 Tax=Emiliania huxleyi TaxID=2903 RepID=A0A0D3K0C1_EMIH1|nr:hypothetical protein EMIHUDRAFT_203748 [Emiliania huxleyi CCMP1516]EOD29206.1 hypothetical protein EMIHUDRAFT_203748 [Emiliania huxleyi CCMP1516]|eukprot:XP_005781635.1 hypothetical protein EMIHUDRAFT_203748 [Emiliania huxleyi CCMP1516]